MTVSKEEISQAILNPEKQALIHSITDVFIDYYQGDEEYGGFSGGVMYDVLVIGYALFPDLFTEEAHCICVDCSDGPLRGKTSIMEGVPNCKIVRSVDSIALKAAFFEALNAL